MKLSISHCTLCLVALLAAEMLCACKPETASVPGSNPAPALEVKTTHPSSGPISRFVTLPGEIKPYQQVTLCAKVAGYLKTINVEMGDQVQEGALLAEIEIPELLADRARYKAEVEVANLDHKRLSDSQSKAPDLVLPQAVDAARARLEIAKASLERAETLLNYAKIIAPFSGIVTRRLVDPGAFIPAATSSGGAQNAALITLTDFNRVRVQVAIPELEAPLVGVDKPVRFTIDALPGKSFEGKVTRFTYALDEATKTMLAEIELPNPTHELRPGMYATVKIGLEHKENSLLLPSDAIVTEKAGVFAFALVENKANKTRVQTGFNDGLHVEILSGLAPDQMVILVGKQQLNDGQTVKPVEMK
jgi:membrane fusion protein (multidrug efflux system)